ncbi:membrane protein DedA, SNARE-associated domain [Roseivivax lentus]|uniref:Membrane protein DedA, SNARE-associated domain n=1 Tax=Roseivivax lentus TaxID=633194 RepID=A0A1N7N667_9RHOB|nr:DedA family protein [Roseivivax lentus]SIS93845.1 membrane protein DedA, SNARE-associated domain [Roseivivax lentus]
MSGWITTFITEYGYWAVAGLMFIENVFPPIPSEIVMPLAGYSASVGDKSLFLMIVAGAVGAIAGAILWYWIGIKIGTAGLRHFAARHGRWLTLTPEDVDRADAWFDAHGHKAVLVGRLIPGVRTLISVPAGLSEMTLRRFLIYTSIGTVIWTAFLAVAGWYLGQHYEVVGRYTGPVSNLVVAVLVLWYLWRVATYPTRGE